MLDQPPTELIREIYQQSEATSDKCNFRLVSKHLERVSFDDFRNEYFTRRNIMLSQDSLQRLIDISRHQALGLGVKQLFLYADYLDEEALQEYASREPVFLPRNEKSVKKCLELGRRRLAEMRTMEELESWPVMLKEALLSLPNLKSIGINHCVNYPTDYCNYPVTALDYRKAYHEMMLPVRCDMKAGTQATLGVLHTLAIGHVQLESFIIEDLVDQCQPCIGPDFGDDIEESVGVPLWALEIPPHISDQLRLSFAHLRKLSLTVSPRHIESEAPQDWTLAKAVSAFKTFMEIPQALEDLELTFTLARPLNQELISGLHLPNLRNLKIYNLASEEGELCRFLMQHQVTLRRLALHYAELRQGNWTAIFRTIHHDLNLAQLDLSCLRPANDRRRLRFPEDICSGACRIELSGDQAIKEAMVVLLNSEPTYF